MKRSILPSGKKILFTLIVMLLLPIGGTVKGAGHAVAEGTESDDKTLSPYFFVNLNP